MTTETAAPTTKKRKLIDVYRARVTIEFAIDMTNAASLADAIAAVAKAKADLTAAGATVETHAGMAKIPAPEKAA